MFWCSFLPIPSPPSPPSQPHPQDTVANTFTSSSTTTTTDQAAPHHHDDALHGLTNSCALCRSSSTTISSTRTALLDEAAQLEREREAHAARAAEYGRAASDARRRLAELEAEGPEREVDLVREQQVGGWVGRGGGLLVSLTCYMGVGEGGTEAWPAGKQGRSVGVGVDVGGCASEKPAGWCWRL